MTEHAPTAAVQEAGCAALGNLASKLGPADHLAAMEGMRAVIQAMRWHPGAAEVQQAALTALRNFGKLAEVRDAASEGLEAVAAVLQAHLGNSGVQEQGLNALSNLASALCVV